MSKFISAIEAKLTGRRAYEQVPLLAVDIERQVATETLTLLEEYRIGVNYGAYIQCTVEERPKAIKDIVEALRDEIYGDFIRNLRLLQRAIYNQKREEQMKIIDKLLLEATGR